MKKSKGVLTLEAALIMPIVIYTMFLMIFMSLLIYTRVYVALSVNHVATIATSQWFDSNSSIYDQKDKYSGVLANAIGTIGASKVKTDNLKANIEKRIESAPMEITKSSVDVTSTNYLVYQNVKIKVDCTFKPPLSGLFKFFGMSDDGTITDSFTKEVKLSSTEANMRFISYMGDVVNRADENGWFSKVADLFKGLTK